jgi:GTP-binding protein YchF
MTCSSQAKTGNYPFCTIDANLSKVPVVDPRLHALAGFAGSKKIVDVEIDLADVAGLIAGASQGAGLGNKFLNDIRPVTIVLHMVRCFEDAREGFDPPEPLAAIATIDAELILADVQSVERRVAAGGRGKQGGGGGGKPASGGPKPEENEQAFARAVLDWLNDGRAARDFPLVAKKPADAKDQVAMATWARCCGWMGEMQLLSGKPVLFVLNVDDQSMAKGNKYSELVESTVGADRCVRVCSLIEEQTSQMSRPERLEFLREYGISEPATEDLLRRVTRLLKLQSFYTIGPQMAKAWSIVQGTNARDAAGEIHGDFAKCFTRGKVLNWEKFKACRNLVAAEEALVPVPASYVMQDGECFVVEHSAVKR